MNKKKLFIFFPSISIAIQLIHEEREGRKKKKTKGREKKKVNLKTQLGLVARVFAENTRVEDRLVDEK